MACRCTVLRLGMFAVAMGCCLLAACQRPEVRRMEVTAYCGCGECCEWHRGSWKYLKLNQWDRYISTGRYRGETYTGRTASGTKPHPYHPGLFSVDSLRRPWWIPFRVVFFPWLMFERPGTIAADTRYYPFGTKLYVPGYGWGIVEDRGGAIKGPDRLDLFYRWHHQANDWGRQHVEVEIYRAD